MIQNPPPGDRWLIVNADDLGQTSGINRGVARAYREGIVTSGSLMVRFDAAEEAAAWAHTEGFDLGLHVDLGEWSYRDGDWKPVYTVVDHTDDGEAVAEELRRQLHRFRGLVGDDPTHLDSHQHQHRSPPLRELLDALGQELDVPVRSHGPIHYDGSFYAQDGRGYPYAEAITPQALVHTIETLPAGVTELGCHPGEGVDGPSMYAAERPVEVQSLCDPRVRAALAAHHVRLVSFAGVRVKAP